MFCLITFYSSKGNLKDKSLIWRHEPLSTLSAQGWLRCVCTCVCAQGKGWRGRRGSSIILWFQNGTFSQINMSDCYLNHWNSQWDAIFSYMNHVEGEVIHSRLLHPSATPKLRPQKSLVSPVLCGIWHGANLSATNVAERQDIKERSKALQPGCCERH